MGEIQERLAIVNQNCVFPIAYGKREDPEHHFFLVFSDYYWRLRKSPLVFKIAVCKTETALLCLVGNLDR